MRRMVALLGMALVMLCAGGCQRQQQPGPAQVPLGPQKGGLVVWAESTDASFLDPGYAYMAEEIDPIVHMFETLIRYRLTPQRLEYLPALATEWTSAAEGKEWTFKLREGVVFHDGSPFNAEAVVFSFKRLLDESHPFYMADRWSYLVDLLGEVVADVVAVDARTVMFSLRRPYAPFLTYLAYYPASIVSPAGVQKYGADFFKHPVGTGPYLLEEWKQGEFMSLVRFDRYWGDQGYLDKILFKVVPEASTRLAEMKAGNIHVWTNPPREHMEALKQDQHVTLQVSDAPSVSYCAINHARKPLDDERVRHAIACGVNWHQIVDIIWGETGQVASSILPPSVAGFHPKLEPYPYDPERARQLLRQAGVKEGTRLDMIIANAPRWSCPDPVTLLGMVQDDLKKLGLDLQARPLDTGALNAAIEAGDYALLFEGWADVPDPNNFLNALCISYGMDGWNYEDADLRELAARGAQTYDLTARSEAYRRMQEIIHDRCIVIPVVYGKTIYALDNKLKGTSLLADGTLLLTQAYMSGP